MPLTATSGTSASTTLACCARFLPTCDAGQLTDFFGPVSAYGWTDTETYGVTLTRQAWFDAPAPSRPRVTLRRT